jgi:hypothetical protein
MFSIFTALHTTKGLLQVGLDVNNLAFVHHGIYSFQSAGVPPISHLHKYPSVGSN